jgi:hypothetical protein
MNPLMSSGGAAVRGVRQPVATKAARRSTPAEPEPLVLRSIAALRCVASRSMAAREQGPAQDLARRDGACAQYLAGTPHSLATVTPGARFDHVRSALDALAVLPPRHQRVYARVFDELCGGGLGRGWCGEARSSPSESPLNPAVSGMIVSTAAPSEKLAPANEADAPVIGRPFRRPHSHDQIRRPGHERWLVRVCSRRVC